MRNRVFFFALALIMLLTCAHSVQGVNPPAHACTYEGKIGPYAVHMTLMFRSDHSVTGTYYYDSQRAKGNNAVIKVSGTYRGTQEDGSLVMDEYNAVGKRIGTFAGELDGGHETDLDEGVIYVMYTITSEMGYKNLSSGKVYPVELTCIEVQEI